MAVSAISQNQLPFAKMKATQFLSRRLIRQFVMIANQFGQANAVMNAPIGTRASRLLHICRIDGSHSVIAGPSAPSQSPLLFGQQMLAKVLQPPFGFAQSSEHRHAADLGQTQLARPDRRLLQRQSPRDVHENQAQPPFAVGQTARTLEKLVSAGSGIEIFRQPATKNLPLFRQRVISHAPKPMSAKSRVQVFRLMLMGYPAYTMSVRRRPVGRVPSHGVATTGRKNIARDKERGGAPQGNVVGRESQNTSSPEGSALPINPGAEHRLMARGF